MCLVNKHNLLNFNAQRGVGMIELQFAILIFVICMVSLATMQIRASTESLDNHQRSTALLSANGLIDRISTNNSNVALVEYRDRVSQIDDCSSYTPKQCEATSSNATAETCSATDMAAFDVWNVFCSAESGLESKLIDYSAALTCADPCTANSDMTLRVSWISKYADSDQRLNAVTTYSDGELASNLDFITFVFRP